MNNTVDLTEKRIFKDIIKKLPARSFSKVPWVTRNKSMKHYDSDEEFIEIEENIDLSDDWSDLLSNRSNLYTINVNEYYPTTTIQNNISHTMTITSNSLNTYTYNYVNDIGNSTSIKYKVDGSSMEKKNDIFGKEQKKKEISAYNSQVPWKSNHSFISDSSVINIRGFRKLRKYEEYSSIYDNPYSITWRTNPSKLVPWNTDRLYNVRHHRYKNNIPWPNYIHGEKNPINSWDLSEDFEDKDITMPNDEFFLRSPEYQREFQIGIN